MSGGVDSSVTAALLKEQGYELLGITMRVWAEGATAGHGSHPPDHLEDARRVAAHLAIPHHTVDFTAAFRERVIDEFVSEYARGRTPNPCVRCNQRLKFGLLQEQAAALGADYLATGHYVRILRTASGSYELHKGVDPGKDQSYFLFPLNQQQLARAIFPLGGLTKSQVRQLAVKYALPVQDKGESQELCFIPDDDYVRFLEESGGVGDLSGEIVDRQGSLLGRHQGTYRYTVGQRKGLGIAASEPLYVLEVDAASRRVIVGSRAELDCSGLLADGLNWIGTPPAERSFLSSCKIRYRHQPVPCQVSLLPGGEAEVRFTTPERAVTPGQAVVFYDGEQLLGGGWIRERR